MLRQFQPTVTYHRQRKTQGDSDSESQRRQAYCPQRLASPGRHPQRAIGTCQEHQQSCNRDKPTRQQQARPGKQEPAADQHATETQPGGGQTGNQPDPRIGGTEQHRRHLQQRAAHHRRECAEHQKMCRGERSRGPARRQHLVALPGERQARQSKEKRHQVEQRQRRLDWWRLIRRQSPEIHGRSGSSAPAPPGCGISAGQIRISKCSGARQVVSQR